MKFISPPPKTMGGELARPPGGGLDCRRPIKKNFKIKAVQGDCSYKAGGLSASVYRAYFVSPLLPRASPNCLANITFTPETNPRVHEGFFG